jgi:hypothetical protein
LNGRARGAARAGCGWLLVDHEREKLSAGSGNSRSGDGSIS